MAVSFHIGVLPQGPIGEYGKLAEAAESFGFDGLWVADSQSGEALRALVVRVEDSHPDGMARIAVHYAAKKGSLWGVTFPNQPV